MFLVLDWLHDYREIALYCFRPGSKVCVWYIIKMSRLSLNAREFKIHVLDHQGLPHQDLSKQRREIAHLSTIDPFLKKANQTLGVINMLLETGLGMGW